MALTEKISQSSKLFLKNSQRKLAYSLKSLQESQKKSIKEGSTQEFLNIKDIYDGIIETYDGKYLGYVEVYPLNFAKQEIEDQLDTLGTYVNLFQTGDFQRFKIKIMNDPTEPTELLSSLKRINKDETNQSLKKELADYMQFIMNQSQNNAVHQSYWFIWEYTGRNGKKDDSKEEIIEEMFDQRAYVEDVFRACGNPTFVPEKDDESGETYNRHVLKFLYKFYNRNTVKYESFDDRLDRIIDDLNIYNLYSDKEDKEIAYEDVISPKGIGFNSRHYMTIDGQCVSFVAISGNHWNTNANIQWIDYLTKAGSQVDIDIIARKLPTTAVNMALGGYNKLSQDVLDSFTRENWITRGLHGKRESTLYYAQAINEMDQELYDVGIILSCRTDSPKSCKRLNKIVKDKVEKKNKLLCLDTICMNEDLFKMTEPNIQYTSSFKYIAHNILTEDLASTYCYTGYEISDSKGFVMGVANNALQVIDNYNSSKYSNANIVILGTSGAGKTATMMMMGRRMYFNGIRIKYIIPKKGFEYERLCKAMNGNFISVFPGSTVCLNPFDIIPEDEMNTSFLGDEITVNKRGSLLSKKISQLITWIQLLAVKEPESDKEKWFCRANMTKINLMLNQLYNDFGITDDNNSIYADKNTRKLKKVPIIQDFYDRIKNDKDLEGIKILLDVFIDGSCKNFNGQTNVSRGLFDVYDCDEDFMEASLFPSMLFLCFMDAYGQIKSNNMVKDMLFLDEVWKMMSDPSAAEIVKDCFKIIRSYGGGCMVATQQINDLKKTGANGDAVLGCSDIKLLLRMEEQEVDNVMNNYSLTQNDKKTITKFPAHGKGMMLTSNDKIVLDLDLTSWELDLFNTAIDKRLEKMETA